MERHLSRRLLVAMLILLNCRAETILAQSNPANAATTQKAVAPSASAVPADRLLPMEATVNGAKSGTWLFLERAGVLYAPREAFDEWRLALKPEVPSIAIFYKEILMMQKYKIIEQISEGEQKTLLLTAVNRNGSFDFP